MAGPHITRYELQLAPGVKMAKVANLKNDLAYALAATEIRILAPIPGKRAVGVEVPNRHRRVVTLGDVFSEPPKDFSPLTVWLGKDVSGKAIPADLAKMPHLLVAGTTGAGKSGAINAMLSSILLRATPDEVRLVLVDPKQVELNHYEAIPHLLTPVITSPRMAANALQNLVREMEWRYGVMSVKRTRSLLELNKLRVREGDKALPYILCVIDELADLMMVAPADVEDSIIRLAQKARAVGIHLVLATQSPRVDVITGMIKANVPSRIAFSVSSQTDSRVILDQNGAESLLGQGDLLFSPVGTSRLQRIQGAYIDEPQIEALTSFWARQGEPELREDLLEEVEPEAVEKAEEEGFDPDEDPLLGDAISLVVEMGTASTSMLQRRLRLGYTRAGRLIDMLERRGIISGYEGSKPRQVLVTEGDLPRVLAALEPAREPESEPVRVPPDDVPGLTLAGKLALRRAFTGAPVAFAPDAGHRHHPAGGAHARPDRHLGDRSRDEDPCQIPARARERGVGPPPGADVRQELPAHLRRRARARRQAPHRGVQAAPRAPQRRRAAADRPARPARAPAPRRGRRSRAAGWWPSSSSGCSAALWVIGNRNSDDGAAQGSTPPPLDEPAGHDRRRSKASSTKKKAKKKAKAKPKVARLTIVATGQVYVCLKAAGKRTPVPGHRPHRRRPPGPVQVLALPPAARDLRGAADRQRQVAQRPVRWPTASATRSRPAGCAACPPRSGRAARPRERARGHRRDGHRGPHGPRDRPQRAVAVRAPARGWASTTPTR